ncbi:LLM class F420-dependent oxidoreductase [Nakamurella lactea]|uniref:LLM class F420-dependent oxidoreductase n=1 Tax=Nakamurella lactea TaxID=459515 RepID=UPI00041A9D01|nr:LLM class F420-dependent oxidoreductase [Nakamurella lactea]
MRTDLGTYGVWLRTNDLEGAAGPQLAAAVEELGFGTLWVGTSRGDDLRQQESLLAATTRLVVSTGILNIWTSRPAATAASYHRIAGRFPDRFQLGVGIGHPENTAEYASPYGTTVTYLDALADADVPADRTVLAALGPRVLRLAGDRTAGAHPYLTVPEHTRQAREILGAGPLLAPEHKVVVEVDPDRARAIGRDAVQYYLRLTNYTKMLRRFGFTEADLADGGSDALVDALVLHGDAETVAAGLRRHLEAGADHVAVHPVGDVLPTLRALAPLLAGAA